MCCIYLIDFILGYNAHIWLGIRNIKWNPDKIGNAQYLLITENTLKVPVYPEF